MQFVKTDIQCPISEDQDPTHARRCKWRIRVKNRSLLVLIFYELNLVVYRLFRFEAHWICHFNVFMLLTHGALKDDRRVIAISSMSIGKIIKHNYRTLIIEASTCYLLFSFLLC